MSNDIRSWLEDLGLGQYAAVFTDNDIDPDILGELTDQDLKDLGVSLGHRKRILKALSAAPPSGIESAEGGAERRQLSIMFCDLVDSTALSVRFDPEDLRAIIGCFQECCERVIGDYGGSVARFMGDGLLVYFGYPKADEHDPERAVRAGLEIIRAVGDIDSWPDLKLQTRVGIATGEVIVGDLIGEGRSREHAVVGETPNLAARLQSLAEPDSVVVSSSTRKLVGGLFEYKNLGLHELKGFTESVAAWRVDHEVEIESRFEAKHVVAGLSPMLGRGSEISLLVQRWEQAVAGDGRAVLLAGEPGIGKSRLIHSLRESIADDPHTVLTYYCLPFRQSSPLFPVATQLERAAGFERDDDNESKLDKLELLVGTFTDELQDLVPLFASVLGVAAEPRYAPLDLSPQLQKARVMAALEQYLSSLASAHPVLVIVEDLHWVDPTTLELLQRLVRGCSKLPALFMLTSRPEFQWPDSGGEEVLTIQLDRLGEEFVRRLVAQVAGNKSIPEELLAQVVEKTDGVPLFVEELTKSLMESSLLVEHEDRFELSGPLPEFAVPETLQDSLMARLDRMKQGKKIAQIGAAIGRSFSYELVSAVAGLGADQLERAIRELTDSELVHEDGAPPHAVYVFKHALIQDAAYSSLLRSKRLAIHNQIAEALELYFPDICKSKPQIPAHHYTEAKSPVRAIPHWHSAARQAIETGNNEEALGLIDNAMALLEGLPAGRERSQFELMLCIDRGVALESTRGYASPEVEETYARASALCEELGNTFDLVPVVLGLYVFHFVRGDLEVAHELAERCVELSTVARQLDGLIESNAALGFVLVYLGEMTEARKTLEKCVTLYESRGGGERFAPITAQDPAVASRSVLAVLLWIMGDAEASRKQLDAAFSLARELHRPINQAVVHTHAAELYQLRGETRLALEHAEQGLRIASDHGDAYWGTLCALHKSIARSESGEAAQSVAEIRETLGLLHAAGAKTNTPYFLMRVAEAESELGPAATAQQTIRQAIEYAGASGEDLFAGLLYRLSGELALTGPEPDPRRAEEHLLRAIEIARTQEARMCELRATNSLCRLRISQNRTEELPGLLENVLKSFPDSAECPDLRQAKELLGSVRRAS